MDEASLSTTNLPLRADGDAVLLTVRVTPKSAKDAVETVESDAAGQSYLKVRVRAVPDKGAANKAVCQVLAKWLGIPKSSVSLHAGDTSRIKQIHIAMSYDELADFL